MDDAYPSEQDDARQLVESCPDCAALAADIRQISIATAQLPTPKRARDFTITAEQAERLRGGRMSRWLRGFSSPGWRALRPVAGAALSIGIVMTVVGVAMPHTAPANQVFSGRNEAPAAAVTTAPVSNPAPQPPEAGGAERSSEPVMAAPGTAAPGTIGSMVAPLASSETGKIDQPGDALANDFATQNPESHTLDNAYAQSQQPGINAGGNDTAAVRDANTNSNLLVYGGLAIALISAALLGLAWFARRRFADPLLR